jgi:hypothetical protein
MKPFKVYTVVAVALPAPTQSGFQKWIVNMIKTFVR